MTKGWRGSRLLVLITILLLGGSSVVSLAADHLGAILKAGVLRWGADAEGGAPYVYPDPEKPERV